MDSMHTSATGDWYLECGEEERVFNSVEALSEAIGACELNARGRLVISRDAGPRPRWQRIFGLAPRYRVGFLSLDWSGDFARLIFLDDNGSEYRAVDCRHPVVAPEAIRAQLGDGDVRSCPADECMGTARAFRAVLYAVRKGQRTVWLGYRFVE